jgi:voltage-gated potassium channel
MHTIFQFFLLLIQLRSQAEQRKRLQRIAKVINRFRVALMLMASAVGIGTTGYMIIEGYTWFEAYYMTVITLASVGFSEVHPLSDAGRLFTSLLIIFNIGLFAYAISTITGIFAEGGFSKLLNDFFMFKKIESLNGHTIVCGYGRHATEVTQELNKQGIPFVVIENNPDKLNLLRTETPYWYVEGDCTLDEVLEEAGIRRAAILVITLPDDADNMFITLSARQINPNLRIICRANNEADEIKIKRAGADHTVVPERIGGFYMATLVKKPDLVEFFNLLSNMGPSNVVFEEILIQELHGNIQGKTIEASGLRKLAPVSLVAVRYPNGQYELNPPDDTYLSPGLHIVLLGNPDQMNLFRKRALA